MQYTKRSGEKMEMTVESWTKAAKGSPGRIDTQEPHGR
jgi:hypothetical protein